MADGGRFQRAPVAKDWAEMGRLLAQYEDELNRFESRVDPSMHLHECFKRGAIWNMVPTGDK
eukprot:7737003-Lingulodinium_polyedra.AAC.1